MVPAPQTAPGVSNRPGGRTMRRPSGPSYVAAASASPFAVNTNESSRGIQRSGSYTWSTPTTELSPLQTSRIARMRTSTRGRSTNDGAQKSGQKMET
jgi:hypothetical protein